MFVFTLITFTKLLSTKLNLIDQCSVDILLSQLIFKQKLLSCVLSLYAFNI